MSIKGIQGQLLELTVVGCSNLKDTDLLSRQDPYVLLEYGSTEFRTRTCTDDDKNPIFQQKFVFKLIDGLREINVSVWNSNSPSSDIFIGGAKVQLHKVLSQGHDDTTWPLQTKDGRNAGEVRSKLHYSNALKPATSSASSAPPYAALPMPPSYAPWAYSTPSPYSPYSAAYPPPPRAPAAPVYPPQFSCSPQFSFTWYAPNSTGYPPFPHSTSPPAHYLPPPYPPTSTYPTPAPATPHATPAYPDPSPYCSYDPANSTGYPSFPAAYPPPPYPPTSTYPTAAPATTHATPAYPDPSLHCSYDPANSTGYPSFPAAYPPPPYPPTSTYPTAAPATPHATPADPDPSPYCSYDPANSTGYPSFPAAYPPPPYPSTSDYPQTDDDFTDYDDFTDNW